MYRRLLRNAVGFLAVLSIVLACTPALARADDKAKPPAEDPEVKLGRANAEAEDKSSKMVTDAAIVDRVNRIGQEIAEIANTTEVPALWGTSTLKKFAYTYKVVDDKDINAFSLPGGFIYVNKGLLDFVKSDDELAGVLAHETAHAAHHHMMKLIGEQNKLQNKMLIPILVGAVLAKADVGNLLMAGQLYMVAKLNTFGIEAEKDADQTGLCYIMKTKYNPVGMLTFMERLAREEQTHPQVQLGIYQTHPPTPERASALVAELEENHIALNRRQTDSSLAAAVGTTDVNGVKLAEVKMSKTVIARLADGDGITADQRARQLVDKLNGLFDQGLEMYEVRVSADKSKILARNQTLIVFTEADAAPQKQSVEALTAGTAQAIKGLIWQDRFNRVASRDDGA